MRLLVEEYPYAPEDVEEVLVGLAPLLNVHRQVCVNYVGYYFNPELQDCVFILPKVLLSHSEHQGDDDGARQEDLVFGKYHPRDLINLTDSTLEEQKKNEFLYEFAVWIYRTICVFNQQNPDNNIVYHRLVSQQGNGSRHLSNTFLDILLSLIEFNRKNADFFTTVLKDIHSGYNKINWTRTVARTKPMMVNEVPAYLNPVNRKRKVNFDDELIIIFFSILRHIHNKYGFPVEIGYGFELIPEQRFVRQYIDAGFGKVRLRQIKYKYFSDKALHLWELCYAFFERSPRIKVFSQQKEYLLVKSFHVVFESMIDELIGDKNLPEGLKHQRDDKRVDHMYSYQGLTTHDRSEDIYYIGDSKYYKQGYSIGKTAVYKQFTYAKNVIQWNLDLFNQKEIDYSYRDEQTEGYNIVPNFFISAQVNNNDLSYGSDALTRHESYSMFQIENRPFDRDTLLVCHYDVNFLFVVSLYARNNALAKATWKEKVRALFREAIIEELTERYAFYAMKPRVQEEADNYLDNNFQKVLGKVYRPFADGNITSLALSKAEDNKELLAELGQYFYVEECPLGHNPEALFMGKETLRLGARQDDCLLSGYIKTENLSVALREGLYYIPASKEDKTVSLLQGFDRVKYIMIYDNRGYRGLYKVKGKPYFLSCKAVKEKGFSSSGEDTDMYIAYNLWPGEATIPNVEIATIPTHWDHSSPIVMGIGQLL